MIEDAAEVRQRSGHEMAMSGAGEGKQRRWLFWAVGFVDWGRRRGVTELDANLQKKNTRLVVSD